MRIRLCVIFLLTLGRVLALTGPPSPIWENGPDQITLEGKTLGLFHEGRRIAKLLGMGFNFIEPEALSVKSSTQDTLILLLRFSETDGYHPDFPRELPLVITHAPNTFYFHAGHPAFRHILIRLEDFGDHYFGLVEKLYPYNAKSPDLRGHTVDVEVYGLGEADYAENYASASSAFFMTSSGYASFFDTFAKGRYRLGIEGMTEIVNQTDTLKWYLFYGKNGAEIHSAYYRVIGAPKKIPIWACGPIFWRDESKGGKDELLEDIRRFTELRIPFTACWIDRPYSHGAHGWSEMNFGKGFEHPEKWIPEVREKFGLEFMTWVAPMAFSDRSFPGLLPGDPGYMDLTHPDAVSEFGRRLKTHQYAFGVKGHKMDRADEHFPLTARWHRPVPESETRNRYVFLYAQTIHRSLEEACGEDQFNFARAAFHRCQPFLSAVWGGDSRSNWQGMAGNQANAIRCGFMGFPIWGQDTGGYLGPGRIDEKLYIRWLQWGLYNGLFEIKIDGAGGSGEDRPPWKYSSQLQKIFREVCEKRMALLPYIYSYANTAYRHGVLMKPLAYVYPSDTTTYSIWDEYLFGEAFLVAPLFSEDDDRRVYLPEGTWYDEADPQRVYRGPCWITVEVPLERIPVFIRGNTIVVTGDIYRGNARLWLGERPSGKLIIQAYPGGLGEEARFDYVDLFDHNREKAIRLSRTPQGIRIWSEALSSPAVLEIRSETRPSALGWGKATVPFLYDAERRKVTLRIKEGTTLDVTVTY